MSGLESGDIVAVLRAAGETTRLRILALLTMGERSVKDLTEILGQSQPRISRHLKLLVDAGLVQRFKEGAWAFFRLRDDDGTARLIREVLSHLAPDDPLIRRDLERLNAVRDANAEHARSYFARHAADWDRLRSMQVAEAEVEAAMLGLLGRARFETAVDLGTGTGRMLQLLADRIERGIGIDHSYDMLAYARTRIEAAGLRHCQVRHGDLTATALEEGVADLVILHQVLHFLDDPARAIAEARRLLRRDGWLVVVDLAPHQLEFLRAEHAHRRLGFGRDRVETWMRAEGLGPETYRELPAKDNTGSLTVALWSARKGRQSLARTAEEAA